MPNALQGLLAPPEMRETPRKNKLMGLLADALTSANEFATKMDPRYENKRENQTLGLLADAVSLGSLAKTAERVAYGERLTNGLRGSKPLLKPETADTVLTLAPMGPKNALAALGMVGGMADNGAMRAATVWHGSPHKFDKFDASKIGTGEGAQAYGHGLYLAEDRGIADVYRKKLTGVDGAPVTRPDDSLQVKIGRLQFEVDRLRKSDDPSAPAMIRAYEGRIRELDGGGNLYKVDLPDDAIAKMLDWDKPLSQQAPEVQKAFAPILRQSLKPYQAVDGSTRYMANINGQQRAFRSESDALSALSSELDGASAYLLSGKGPQSSDLLTRQGVPGVRYLDGGSRGAGTGTSNFVVFPGNEGLLSILERNGQPLK